MLVTEAVGVFAVVLGRERVVSVGDRLLVGLVLAAGVEDLEIGQSAPLYKNFFSNPQRDAWVHTQKSMSRLPALPNSLSPTW